MKAFPCKEYAKTSDEDTTAEIHSTGMDLRDYFAAKAMQGLIGEYGIEYIAKFSYEMADAMMEARKK